MLRYQSVYLVSAKGLPQLPFGDGHRMLLAMEFEDDEDVLLIYPATLEAAAIKKGQWNAMQPTSMPLIPRKVLRRLERNAAELTALGVSYAAAAVGEAMTELRDMIRQEAPPPPPRIRTRTLPSRPDA